MVALRGHRETGTQSLRYDVTPDGGVVLIRPETGDGDDDIVVVEGWLEALKRLDRANRR